MFKMFTQFQNETFKMTANLRARSVMFSQRNTKIEEIKLFVEELILWIITL